MTGAKRSPAAPDIPTMAESGLAGFEVSRKDAEDMIMAARIAAGWITEDDLARMKAEAEAKAAAAAAAAEQAAAAGAAAAPARV